MNTTKRDIGEQSIAQTRAVNLDKQDRRAAEHGPACRTDTGKPQSMNLKLAGDIGVLCPDQVQYLHDIAVNRETGPCREYDRHNS
ncbi:MAG TPA: hypothetical protein DEV64_08285 [Rhodospirillaceae bacterium]|nr:hypothetical protein [Rhodospirillaceae bacterium]